MDENRLSPIFQLTNPNYGKSQAEIVQDRIKAAQEAQYQNLASQMDRAQGLRQEIDQTQGKELNKGGAVAAALADMFNPQANTFGKVMAMHNATPDQRAQLQAQLDKTQSDIGRSASMLGRGDSFQQQKELANLRHQNAMKRLEAQNKMKGSGLNLTPGEEKVDKAFAPDYQSWISGGYANTKANLNTYQGVLGQLQPGMPELGGKVAPQAVRAYYEPDVVGVEQSIERITFQSLKAILGGNFTKDEANRMVEQAYNPRLLNKQNRDKASTMLNQLRDKMDAKQQATLYFQKNGTLKGFQGKNFETMDDFYDATKKDLLGDKYTPSKDIKVKMGTIVDGYEFNGGDPKSKDSWIKVEGGK